MNPNYPGIDYGRGLSNIDKETGIRYGVISQHSLVGEALDEIMQNGRDLAREEALREAIGEARANSEDPDSIDEDRIAEDLGLNWETNLYNYLYEEDGLVLTGCLDSDLMVIKSPYYTYAPFCSPCVPGAGNLDGAPTVHEFLTAPVEQLFAAQWPRVYCLGHDWFDGGQAPYIIFRVDQPGTEVLP